MEKTIKKLKAAFWSLLCAALFVSLVFESDLLVVGILTDSKQFEFVLTACMELFTIGSVPFALKLFKIKKVADSLAGGSPRSLLKWGLVRMALLGILLFVNVVFYYLFMQVAFGYMAIILLISMLFVYPGRSRCLNETRQSQSEE